MKKSQTKQVAKLPFIFISTKQLNPHRPLNYFVFLKILNTFASEFIKKQNNFSMRTNILIFTRLMYAVCLALLTVSVISWNTGTQQSDTTNGQRIEWTRVGIGGGGAQFSPEISPHDPKIALVTCDMGGSYITHDGGESWKMFNFGGRARFFVFDPVDPNVVYAQASRLLKSSDKGLTWSAFYPKPADDDPSGGARTPARQSVQAFAIDPAQSKTLYAAIRDGRSLALYVSTDGGEGWTKEKEFDNDVKNIFIDPSPPTDQRTLYVTWSNGVEQRINGKWQSFGAPGKDVKFNFFTGGYDAASKKYILYAISGKGYFNRDDTPSGIFFSDNGGKTWENRQEGLLNYCTSDRKSAEFRALATSALNPATLYVSYNSLAIHADTTCIGVAKSMDFGKTWTLPWQDKMTSRGGDIPMPNYSGCWLNENFGSTWGENPFNLAVSPVDPNVCYGTDFGRTIKTENGGKTWEPLFSKRLPDGSWVTRGLDVTTCYTIVFDPFDKDHIFIATTDIGLQESKNGGKGWTTASTQGNGVPRNWRSNTYWVQFDPDVKGRIWAAMSRDHDLPRAKMFRNGGVDKYQGGIVLTNDGATTWQTVSSSMGEAAVTHILLDPTSKKDTRTLYACAFGKGVYKSTDGGLTWVQKNKGIEGAEPFAWHIERRESDGTLFLIVSRRSEGSTIGTEGDGALYKSTDGAETWTKMTLPEGCNGPADLVTTKKYPKRLVFAAEGRTSQDRAGSMGGGIYISDDEGQTWTHVMDYERYIYGIIFDSRNNRFYACGSNAAAYYSEDGAMTWTKIKGFNFRSGHRIDLDPRDPNMIFATTFGGGVWYGPANGDPEATNY